MTQLYVNEILELGPMKSLVITEVSRNLLLLSIFKEVFGEISFLLHGKRHRILPALLRGICYILFYVWKLQVDFGFQIQVEILGLAHSVCRNFRSKLSTSIFSVMAFFLYNGVTGHLSQYRTLQPRHLDLILVMVLMSLFIQSRQLLCVTEMKVVARKLSVVSGIRKRYHSNMQVSYEINLPCCGHDEMDISVLKASEYLRHANAI